MGLRVTQAGLDINEAFEGDELKGYICPAGVPTIGRGITEGAGLTIRYTDGVKSRKVRVGKKISQRESDRLYREATDNAAAVLTRLLKREAKPHQFDAMYLLLHNIGTGDLKRGTGGFVGSTVLRKFNAGDIAGASRAFEAWNKITVKRNGKRVKVVAKGLVRRRAAEQALFDGDVERAYALAQTTRKVPMPQSVEKPEKSKSLANEPAVTTGVIVGGGTAAGKAIEQAEGASSILDTLTAVKDSVLGFLDGVPLGTIVPIIALGIAGYLIWRGYNHWRDNEVDGDEELAEDVEDIV